jgi:hypothetical protein
MEGEVYKVYKKNRMKTQEHEETIQLEWEREQYVEG